MRIGIYTRIWLWCRHPGRRMTECMFFLFWPSRPTKEQVCPPSLYHLITSSGVCVCVCVLCSNAYSCLCCLLMHHARTHTLLGVIYYCQYWCHLCLLLCWHQCWLCYVVLNCLHCFSPSWRLSALCLRLFEAVVTFCNVQGLLFVFSSMCFFWILCCNVTPAQHDDWLSGYTYRHKLY